MTAVLRAAGERQVAARHQAAGRGSTGSDVCRGDARTLVEAAAEPRRLAMPATMAQLFLRHDATHELPHVVETEAGIVVARFALAGDVAIFVNPGDRRDTLPTSYLEQVARAGDRACNQARKPVRLHEDKNAGGPS